MEFISAIASGKDSGVGCVLLIILLFVRMSSKRLAGKRVLDAERRKKGNDGPYMGVERAPIPALSTLLSHFRNMWQLNWKSNSGVAHSPPLQISENLQRGFGEVEGVEVDAFDFVVDQLLHLPGGPLDADFGDLFVVRGFEHLAEQR